MKQRGSRPRGRTLRRFRGLEKMSSYWASYDMPAHSGTMMSRTAEPSLGTSVRTGTSAAAALQGGAVGGRGRSGHVWGREVAAVTAAGDARNTGCTRNHSSRPQTGGQTCPRLGLHWASWRRTEELSQGRRCRLRQRRGARRLDPLLQQLPGALSQIETRSPGALRVAAGLAQDPAGSSHWAAAGGLGRQRQAAQACGSHSHRCHHCCYWPGPGCAVLWSRWVARGEDSPPDKGSELIRTINGQTTTNCLRCKRD